VAGYILRRGLEVIPTVLLVLTLVFLALRVLPGDPAIAALGEYATPEAIATAGDYIERSAPPPSLRRLLTEGRDDVARALRCRQRDAQGS